MHTAKIIASASDANRSTATLCRQYSYAQDKSGFQTTQSGALPRHPFKNFDNIHDLDRSGRHFLQPVLKHGHAVGTGCADQIGRGLQALFGTRVIYACAGLMKPHMSTTRAAAKGLLSVSPHFEKLQPGNGCTQVSGKAGKLVDATEIAGIVKGTLLFQGSGYL
jgi:hypothetical protein